MEMLSPYNQILVLMGLSSTEIATKVERPFESYLIDWDRLRTICKNLPEGVLDANQIWDAILQAGFVVERSLVLTDPAIRGLMKRFYERPGVMILDSCSGYLDPDEMELCGQPPYLSVIFPKIGNFGASFLGALQMNAAADGSKLQIQGAVAPVFSGSMIFGPKLSIVDSLQFGLPILIGWQIEGTDPMSLLKVWNTFASTLSLFDDGAKMINTDLERFSQHAEDAPFDEWDEAFKSMSQDIRKEKERK
jgi:hypothetical protein